REYTQPEEYIQSRNPIITDHAQSIVGSETNPYHKAKKIYDWIVDNIVYDWEAREKDALWVLRNKRGVCTGYSYLFVALCRAVGIPARICFGHAITDSNEETGHMWSEFYLPNYGWIPVDLTFRQFAKLDHNHYYEFKGLVKEQHTWFRYWYMGIEPKIDYGWYATRKASSIDSFPDEFVKSLY
ncbi:MAG: transglutaminase-like domain-containing protein, partial [Candidatus Bathyarchaeia archaeon]